MSKIRQARVRQRLRSEFRVTAEFLGDLLEKKNLAYGNAFQKTGDFLKLLYPNGIQPKQYRDALLIVRIFDKMMRIANNATAFEENPFLDIAGYGILGTTKSKSKDISKRSL